LKLDGYGEEKEQKRKYVGYAVWGKFELRYHPRPSTVVSFQFCSTGSLVASNFRYSYSVLVG